jgi:predicted metalloprotease with PDZ domain
MFKIKTTVLFFLFFAFSQQSFFRIGISFLVSQPQTHMLEIEMRVKDDISDSLIFKLPVWTPGYYKIVDYPINLYDFGLRNNKAKDLNWGKTSKNTWVVKCAGEKEETIRYKIYAFDNIPYTIACSKKHIFNPDTLLPAKFQYKSQNSVV